MSGDLIVNGPGQGEVCFWRCVWRQALKVKRRGVKGYIGTEDGAKRFEVKENETVDPGDVWWSHGACDSSRGV